MYLQLLYRLKPHRTHDKPEEECPSVSSPRLGGDHHRAEEEQCDLYLVDAQEIDI